MASHDPNHPENLNIKPSSSGRRQERQKNCSPTTTDDREAWEIDSANDIERWGIAGRIWEAAYLFRQYLTPAMADVEFDPPCALFESPHDKGEQKRNILELGSGAGFVGIACAQRLRDWHSSSSDHQRRDTMILTDLENVCDLMTRNADAAGFSQDSHGKHAGVNVLVRALPWGSSNHAGNILQELTDGKCITDHPLDFILCSDLVYFPELLAPLLRSLVHLTQPQHASSTTPPVMIAYKIRSLSKEEPFWSNLGVWFNVSTVSCRYLPDRDQTHWGSWHRFGSFASDVDGSNRSIEQDSEDDYFIFIAERKSSTFHFEAPTEDDKLMSGFMLAQEPDPLQDQEPVENRLVRGDGGADFLEWALMGSLSV